MATVMMPSDSMRRRQKEVTYGKSSRKPAANYADDTSTTERTSPFRSSSLPRLTGTGQLKPRKKQGLTSDNGGVFDVPSSDEDEAASNTQPSLARSRKQSAKPLPGRSAQPGQGTGHIISSAASSTSDRGFRKRKRPDEPSKIDQDGQSEADDIYATLQTHREAYQKSSAQSSRSTSHSSSRIRHEDSGDDRIYATTENATPKPITKRALRASEIPAMMVPRPRTPSRSLERNDDMLMSTPPRQTGLVGTPKSISKGTLTPRQARMWENLLGDEVSISPAVDLDTLNIHTAHKHESTTGKIHLQPRRKLVDALSQPPSHYASEAEREDSKSEDEKVPSPTIRAGSYRRSAEDSQISSQNLSGHSVSLTSQPVLVAESGPKITYSSQRSYLEEPAQDFESSLRESLLGNIDSFTQKSSKSKEKPDWFESEDNPCNSGMRSIHDLRASGDNTRFDDQINILLEDLQLGSTVSRKRGAVLDLAGKLTDQSYITRFIKGGYEMQVLRLCKNEKDPILGSALSWAIFVLLSTTFHTQTAYHVYDIGILDMLADLLPLHRDLTKMAKDRSSNMSKIAQESVINFCLHVKKFANSHVDPDQAVSPRLLALTCIDLLVHRLREAGNCDAILDERLITGLLSAIPSPLTHRLTEIKFWELTTSILECCTIAPSTTSNQIPWTSNHLVQLVDLAESGLYDTIDSKIILLTLRLLLNMTNNQKSNCNAFSTPKLIGRLVQLILDCFAQLSTPLSDATRLNLIDELVLSLGVMINVAEWSDKARLSTIDPSTTPLDSLVNVFVKGRDVASLANSMAESHSNVGYGYLAILLGNLCQNEDVRARVLLSLPDHRLRILTEAVEEFIMFHKKVDLEESAARGEDSNWALLSQKLQIVADSLKAYEDKPLLG